MKRPLRRVVVEGAGKLNIGWRVGDRRSDGYHDVRGLIQTISLVDRLEITSMASGPLVQLEVPGHPELETDANLIVAAAETLAERTDPGPVRIVVHKTIPIAAGLGGGSADAAAALVGLSALWHKGGITAAELLPLGASVGSDVPPILLGGLVHVSGRGEVVRHVGETTGYAFVLGISEERVSAADAYAMFDRMKAERSDRLHANDLEEAATTLVPGLTDRLKAMRIAARIAFITGSGPTVVGVASDENEAELIAGSVRRRFAHVIVARPQNWGVRLSVGT